MATLTITGASDDLVEIGGDFSEEFNYYSRNEDDKRYLGVSDGTVLSVNYDKDGIWRFALLCQGSSEFSKSEGVAEQDTNDVITLTGDIKWVLFGDAIEVRFKRKSSG